MTNAADHHDDHSGHDHSHHHPHGFTGHAHGASERRVAIAAALTGSFMLAEVVGGLVSGSLALLADAGHMLTDFAALLLAFAGFRIARRPGDGRRTYGYDRFQVLAAFVNGLALFVIAGIIVFEAVRRLADPVEVLGGPMLAIAVAGLLVNVGVFALLHGADRENLNIRGATLHVLGDLLGSVAAIAAAGVVLATGWTPIDPILSILVSLIILVSAWRLVREAGHVLLEGVPTDIEIADVERQLVAAVPGLQGVHHVHIWALVPEKRAATLHAVIADNADAGAVTRAVKGELARRFSIGHVTVEIEHGTCADAPPAAGNGGPAHDHHHGHGRPHACRESFA